MSTECTEATGKETSHKGVLFVQAYVPVMQEMFTHAMNIISWCFLAKFLKLPLPIAQADNLFL